MDLPRIKPSTAAIAAGIAMVLSGMYCVSLWQPERQLRLHNANLLEAVGDRNFRRVSAFLAADYSDPWNESGEIAMQRLQEVMRQYFSVSVRENGVRLETADGTGEVVAYVTLDGKGTAFAEMVTRRVNGLTEPFVFRWRKESWRPWDWKLVRVENPALHWEGSGEFWE